MTATRPSGLYYSRVAIGTLTLGQRKRIAWERRIEIAFYVGLRRIIRVLEEGRSSTADLAPWAALALMVGFAFGFIWRAALP